VATSVFRPSRGHRAAKIGLDAQIAGASSAWLPIARGARRAAESP